MKAVSASEKGLELHRLSWKQSEKDLIVGVQRKAFLLLCLSEHAGSEEDTVPVPCMPE